MPNVIDEALALLLALIFSLILAKPSLGRRERAGFVYFASWLTNKCPIETIICNHLLLLLNPHIIAGASLA